MMNHNCSARRFNTVTIVGIVMASLMWGVPARGARTIIALTVDEANTTSVLNGNYSKAGAVGDDSFSYNPNDATPYSPGPNQSWTVDQLEKYQGSNVACTVDIDFNGTYTNIVLDLWGRTDATFDVRQRPVTITFYKDHDTQTHQVADTNVISTRASSPASFGRYTAPADVQANRVTILGPAYFNLAEAAAAGLCATPPVISAAPFSLDFGNAFTGESTSLSVTVSNAGLPTLVIDSLTDTDPSNVFSVVEGTPINVLAGATTTLTVQYAPFALGTHTGTLHIGSNDPDTPITNITLSGSSRAREIIALTVDEANTTSVLNGNYSKAGAVGDGTFAYDPNDGSPETPGPNQNFHDDQLEKYQGSNVACTVDIDFNGTYDNIVLDLWGRTDDTFDVRQRPVTITFYEDHDIQTHQIADTNVISTRASSPSSFGRYTAPADVQANRVTILGPAYFNLAEAAAAGLPLSNGMGTTFMFR